MECLQLAAGLIHDASTTQDIVSFYENCHPQQQLYQQSKIQKEFLLPRPDLNAAILTERWTEMLTKLIQLFNSNQVTNTELETKNKTPPTLVVITNSNGTLNKCYIVGDGLEIEAGKRIKYATELLLIFYCVYDLSYPKCYQLFAVSASSRYSSISSEYTIFEV